MRYETLTRYSPETDSALSARAFEARNVYLAGPFFNAPQIAEVRQLEEALKRCGLSFFSPMKECLFKPGDPPIVADRASWLNRYHIDHCDLVVALLSFPDTGTAWELGWAEKTGRPRLGVTSNSRVLTNLMVARTVNAMVAWEDHERALRAIAEEVKGLGAGETSWRRIVEKVHDKMAWTGDIE